MWFKGATDDLRYFFDGFNKTKKPSTVLRKERESWNGFPYEKQNLYSHKRKTTEEIKKIERQIRKLNLNIFNMNKCWNMNFICHVWMQKKINQSSLV